ncbi:MAG: nucleotidyltransferase family protein [Pseudomonadota bacterium]|nr:nucleotidyltransferase family protein [Pseudomonadota bacterium]
MIESAMILAAGLGTRMQPLTNDRPKPMIEIAGRPMLDLALDHAMRAGVRRAVVNVHYMADMIIDHLAGRTAPEIIISHETKRLETGGGTRQALPALGDAPFFVLNTDNVWFDGPEVPALARLESAFDPARMDALLLLIPRERAIGHEGTGDYALDAAGRAQRNCSGFEAEHVFTGVHILSPTAFAGTSDGPFSLCAVWDKAEVRGRLFGLVHDGQWYHIDRPDKHADMHESLTERLASVYARPSSS